MNKAILCTGVILGLLAVVSGAFGAHGLKALVDSESLQTFETGVKYQMYHALLLLFLGGTNYVNFALKKVIYFLILTGVILFSGSLYGLAVDDVVVFNVKKIGYITPIGGTLLIVAWGILFWSLLRLKINVK